VLKGLRWGERAHVKPGSWGWFIAAGVLLGATFYTYLAARIMWAVFPAVALGLMLTRPGALKRVGGHLAAVLGVAAVAAAPLFIYLQRNPGAEVRLSQLSGPLDALRTGDPMPLLTNAFDGLAMLTFAGDDLWLYNIPGRPLLNPLMGVLFYVGIVVAVVGVFKPYGGQEQRSVLRMASLNLFMLGTLLAGLSPALVTGAGASNVRVIGAQPALYYFPAIAVMWAARRLGDGRKQWAAVGFASVLTLTAVWGTHDYFVRWANARDVRVAYHTTLVETLRYIEQHEVGDNVALSSITPGPFHDAAVGEMVVRQDDIQFYWFDGRSALVYPLGGETTYFFPEVAAAAPYFEPAFPDRTLRLRPSDFNRTVNIYTELAAPPPAVEPSDVTAVDDLLRFRGYTIDQQGTLLTAATYWEVLHTVEDEFVMFTQALGPNGQVVAQQDYLGYPTTSWHPGAQFIQVHTLNLPPEVDTVRLISGVYTLADMERLPVTVGDTPSGDTILLTTLDVTP
jgi:hypothetical protein